jgi:putative endonuclease
MRERSRGRREAYRHGHAAEAAAMLFLLAKGFRPIARRYKTPLGEVDLIVKRGRLIAFVEVKARALERDALESVGPPRSGSSRRPTSGSPNTRPPPVTI